MIWKRGVTRCSLMYLWVLVLAAAPTLLAGQTAKDSEEVSKLLADARARSAQLDSDAAEMEGYTISRVDWQTYASMVERVGQDVDNATRLAYRLKNARDAASPWQQEAIDRIDPLLNELASSVNSTVSRFSRASAVLHMPPYKDYAAANARLANDLAKLISNFVDYAEAKARSQELESDLEIESYD